MAEIFFFDFGSKTERNAVLKRIVNLAPKNLNSIYSRKVSEVLRRTGITERWKNREISNFEYLMELNTISGRTYNDLNQYHIFPWIIQDWDSDTLDLSNSETYRDLTKPIGALNPERLESILQRYNSLSKDSEVKPFHYGSHYSNAGIVISYLLRLEPFSSLHMELQGGRFDYPDRLFSSIKQTWVACTNSLSTYKELIPEFFYMPEFLENINHFNLGMRQNGVVVNDIELPPWASSAEDLICKHRLALESEHVSANLHHWIDLIWGYKQRGIRAEEAQNIFYHLTYEGAIDFESLDDPILRQAIKEQIAHFGQTPLQLFSKTPHPQRNPPTYTISRSIHDRSIPSQKIYGATVNDHTPLHKISQIREQIICCSDAEMTVHTFTDREFVLDELPHTIIQSPHLPPQTFMIHSAETQGYPSSIANPKMLVLDERNLLAYTGNNWDWSLRVYTLENKRAIKWQLTQCFVRHKARITCLARNGNYLVSGSDDCTIIVWRLESKSVSKRGWVDKDVHILRGHHSAIIDVAVHESLDFVLSSSDGSVLTHSLRTGQFLRHIELPKTPDFQNVVWQPSLLSITVDGTMIFFCPRTTCIHTCDINARMWKHRKMDDHIRVTQTDPSSQFLLIGGKSGNVSILSLRDLSTQFRFVTIRDSVCSAVFSHDMNYVWVGTETGYLYLYAPVGLRDACLSGEHQK